jgi:hypothetical protein
MSAVRQDAIAASLKLLPRADWQNAPSGRKKENPGRSRALKGVWGSLGGDPPDLHGSRPPGSPAVPVRCPPQYQEFSRRRSLAVPINEKPGTQAGLWVFGDPFWGGNHQTLRSVASGAAGNREETLRILERPNRLDSSLGDGGVRC